MCFPPFLMVLRISIHALHEESDPYLHAVVESVPISIHALHEESATVAAHVERLHHISIHALHEESD